MTVSASVSLWRKGVVIVQQLRTKCKHNNKIMYYKLYNWLRDYIIILQLPLYNTNNCTSRFFVL